jgi:hypothetical protein
MKYAVLVSMLALIAAMSGAMVNGIPTVVNAQSTFDITTLAGKVASLNGTAGLQIRFSALIEHEADVSDLAENPDPFAAPITPVFVLSSSLDGTNVTAPDVTVNLDTAAAPQNETTLAVDPNNHNRIVAAANDYVTRTWPCVVGITPCSKLGDGYSGTYYSNDGGAHWCCVSTDPSHLGTLIPGVDHLAGGQYDAGGDPAVAFDSRGHVYYAGLGFDRAAPPNTVAVNKGTFDGTGKLTWGPPTFINPTTSPAIFNDKEWIAADSHPLSPFRDRVYVSWTRFIFNPVNGAYVQSPIFFAFSTDGGETFSDPVSIVGNVHVDQGSRPVVGSDGTVYVFFEGATRLATFSSTYMVKSTDGGISWSRPVAVAPLVDILPPFNTVFRVNSLPAAAISPYGDLYVAWSSEIKNIATGYSVDAACASWITPATLVYGNCHAASFFSKSTDFGATWSTPALIFPARDASSRTAIGYPVTQPTGAMLNAPPARRVDTFFPAVAISPSGRIYMSAYAADVVSPWQRCATPATPTAVGRINCLALDKYIHNARLDYVVTDLTTGVTKTVSTHPINSRYGFGGGFIGDYTDIAVGSDDVFHALWTDTNNLQQVVWWYGYQFVSTPPIARVFIHQQDAVVRSDEF